jgi:hypothetical protein
MGRDATIDTAIVSITNAKNLGPSGAGENPIVCVKFEVAPLGELTVLDEVAMCA